jgi:hypothetical protein
MPLRVQANEMDTSSPDEVVINNNSFINHLIQDQEETMSILKLASPAVSVKDLSVDSTGKVVINNKEFAEKMRELIKNSPPKEAAALDNTGVCGAAC